MSIQLYGQFHDYNSFSGVSRAIANELHRKRFDISVYGINTLNQHYVDVFAPIGLNNHADIGLFIGYPEAAPGWLSEHNFKVLVTVCETDRVPPSWVEACNTCDLVVVPSSWCYDAFKNSGVNKPIIIVHHGIYADLALKVRKIESKAKNFLHVSGSLTFAARKGTSKLLRAYKRLVDDFKEVPDLDLKIPNTEGVRKTIEYLELQDKIHILPEESLDPQAAYMLYRNALAVVQPSRAEGFGLVPLEARCVRTPVIATSCTGHMDHFVDGVDIEINTGPTTPLETQANPAGNAPLVTEDAVYDAFVKFRVFYINEMGTGAPVIDSEEYIKNWDWSVVLTPLIKELKSVRVVKHRVKLGAGASLRGTD